MKPLLVFHNHLYETSNLIEGRLLLIDKESDQVINEYRATSGCPGSQESLDVKAKGRGPIPKASSAGIKSYSVSTAPIYMPQIRGVEGNFYKIDPYSITVDGTERGDFGVHADKNVPGSSGCVVLTSSIGWDAFQKDMKQLANTGYTQVPLLVSYSN